MRASRRGSKQNWPICGRVEQRSDLGITRGLVLTYIVVMAGCGGGWLHARTVLGSEVALELSIAEGSSARPVPRAERHIYAICEAARVRELRHAACPVIDMSTESRPVVRFDKSMLDQLQSSAASWCIVVDERFHDCVALPELRNALSALRRQRIADDQAAEEARQAEAREREEQRLRELQERRRRAQSELASRLDGCNMVGRGAFIEGADSQRLWLCPQHGILVDDGERVIYQWRDEGDEFSWRELANVNGAHLTSVTGAERDDLVLELREFCVEGIVVLAWRGAFLHVAWTHIVDDGGCGSGDQDVDYEGVSDWWPAYLAQAPEQPSYTFENGSIRWFGDDAQWNGTTFQPSESARERWNEHLDAEVVRLLGDGRPAEAIHYLRPEAPVELRQRVQAECERAYLRAIDRARTVDRDPEYDLGPPTENERAEWRARLAARGLACAPESERLIAARRRAITDIVVSIAEEGGDYSRPLAELTDPVERQRLNQRAQAAARRAQRVREAARERQLRDQQRQLAPERVLIGTWQEIHTGVRERYRAGGRCGVGRHSRCRYRWLGRPELRDDGTVTQVMLVRVGRMRGVYQVVTSVDTGRDLVMHISETGRTYTYRRAEQ